MPYPIDVRAEYPTRQSRAILILRTLFSSLYVGVPHGVCLAIYGVAVFVVQIVAWFAILFTGQFPKDLYDFVLGFKRWQMRVQCYLFMLTDEYPPFSSKE